MHAICSSHRHGLQARDAHAGACLDVRGHLGADPGSGHHGREGLVDIVDSQGGAFMRRRMMIGSLLAVCLTTGLVSAETCLSPYIKGLRQPEKVMYLWTLP